MSRIGKQPISVPSGVEVKLDSDQARVKGPKGELQVRLNELVSVAQTEGELTFLFKIQRIVNSVLCGDLPEHYCPMLL